MSTETPENEQPLSSAKQFKKQREAREKGDILTLTSGLSVHVRRPDVQKLIAMGLIPAQMVQGFMTLQEKGVDKLKPEELGTLLGFQREIAKHALLEPKCVENPDYDKNEIAIDDIGSEDLDDIWAYVNGGLEAVEKFRKERNSGDVSGLNSKEVSEPKT